MSTTKGKFVWFDLLTADTQGAKTFYSEIVGWKTTPWSGGSHYELWTAGDAQIGGVMSLSEDARKAGTPPHWLGYAATDNVDATLERAQKMRGRVLVPGKDIPNTGRYAILADPQGAEFGIFQSLTEESAPDSKAVGHFNWAELNTTDWKSAWPFYSELFGWIHTGSMEMGGELGEYFMFGADTQRPFGGMSNSAKQMRAPAHWLHYVNVKNADEAAKQIPRLRGTVTNGPMDVPGGGRIAQGVDPQGAPFAIVSG